MRPSARSLPPLLLVLFVALPSLSGCEMVRKKLACNWTDTITQAEPGTPEWPVQQIIMGAMNPNEEAGWEQYRGAMHSSEIESRGAETMLRQLNYPKTRRLVPLYLADDTVPVFEVCYEETLADGVLNVFVKNEKSETPTPCRLKRDPKANGAWRAYLCSL
ncbi:MAG: hypothetical protein H6744_09855 [Deltaproteobacteria bacterium]|nr:hypothetical protein [Deltaproteobacteria bacterium]MCB9786982.1 hypothetical protein [Deltaproteobacteria bacterium]